MIRDGNTDQRETEKQAGERADRRDADAGQSARVRRPRSAREAALRNSVRTIRRWSRRRSCARPYSAAGTVQILRQHAKGRMTVWERIDVLQDTGAQPTILYQNWGKNLDGASIVTAVLKIGGRDVALYGHDFTVRAGSMDATNGRKLANLIYLAGEPRHPAASA